MMPGATILKMIAAFPIEQLLNRGDTVVHFEPFWGQENAQKSLTQPIWPYFRDFFLAAFRVFGEIRLFKSRQENYGGKNPAPPKSCMYLYHFLKHVLSAVGTRLNNKILKHSLICSFKYKYEAFLKHIWIIIMLQICFRRALKHVFLNMIK
jgi:hypothetical protein